MIAPTRLLALALLASSAQAAGYVPANRDLESGPIARVRAGTLTADEVLDRFAASYHPETSGDVMFCPAPGVWFTSRPWPYNHGSPWDYDARIPLIFYGPGQVRAGTHHDRDAQSYDIPATLAHAVGLAPPASNIGQAREGIFEAERLAPRAMLTVVMDQVGLYDIMRHAHELPHLTRMRTEGAAFHQVRVGWIPTFTGVSHASIGTGAPPAVHGVSNNFLPRDGRTRIGVAFRGDDGVVLGDLRAETWAEALDRQTGGEAKVVTQIYADYAAVAVTGHGRGREGGDADAVVWFDAKRGVPTTDPRYFRLPRYLEGRSVDEAIRRRGFTWNGEGKGQATYTKAERKKFMEMPGFARWQADNMLEMMVRERIGADDVPDLAQVNLKSTDATGHQRNHEHPSFLACLKEVDRFLGAAERLLKRRAGEGRYLISITADHGVAPSDGVPRYYPDLTKWLGERLDARSDADGVSAVTGIDGFNVFLNPTEAADEGHRLEVVRDLLLEDPHVQWAWTKDEVIARARELGYRAGTP